MPKFVRYDHNAPAPAPALGWYDTDLVAYPSMPPSADLLQLTDQDWAHHMQGGHWGVSGHTLVSMDAGPEVPALPASMQAAVSITRYQAMAVLDSMPGTNGKSLYDTIDAAILAGKSTGAEGRAAWLAWTTAGTFERNSPMIAQMAALFGITDAQIDTIFATGATVRA
ncbi:MAG: hypothetical protein JWP29_3532 [Rhodoferax sp.]|nr:hypothetical protein [Rhodoferax sp.]